MQLHFQRYGEDGPPLLILHGLLGSGENWRTLSRQFAAYFSVYALDLRNHGQSPHDDAFDYHVMAADVQGFMDDQGLASAILIGHSMGGKVAMQFALTHPDRVDHLVVVDIAPKAYPPGHVHILDALAELDLDAVHSRKEALAALAPRIHSPAIRQFLLKNLTPDDGGYRWMMNLPVIRARYRNTTLAPDADGTFEQPTLFIRGGASPYIRDDDLETIRAFFPHAELVTLDNAGHWVHAEAPKEFAEVVLAFLNVAA